MPRRNRRKLHRALRHRAEKKAQDRATRRRANQQARETAERAIARALARPKAMDAAASARPAAVVVAWASMRGLLELAGVDRPTTKRVQQLLYVVGEQVPSMARCELLPWLLLLARRTWHRPPSSWRAPGGSDRRKRDDLAKHLLTAFPVPAFLVRALDVDPLPVARVPLEDEWAVRLLSWIGQGRSLRKVPSEVLPTPLTRQMAHRFLSSTAATTPISALRHAQVLGHGGTPTLARRLLRTRLGVLRGSDPQVGEPFWDRVIAWLAGRPALWEGELDHVLGWVESAQREATADGRALVLRGRTDHAVQAAARSWWARQQPPRGHFPMSGLQPLAYESWEVVELDTPEALREEGRAMSHCVGTYVGLARKRRVSLWSIRQHKERLATVEVALPAAAVVQAKAKANRAISAQADSVLRMWARHNHLRLRLRP